VVISVGAAAATARAFKVQMTVEFVCHPFPRYLRGRFIGENHKQIQVVGSVFGANT
jgi:hypothetical protein